METETDAERDSSKEKRPEDKAKEQSVQNRSSTTRAAGIFRWSVKVFRIGLEAVGVIALVSTFAGKVWPTSPVIGLPAPSNSLSSELPFPIENTSAWFRMVNVELQCYVVLENDVPLGGQSWGSVSQSAFVKRVGDIAPGSTAQGRCDYDPNSVPDFQLSVGGQPLEIDESQLIHLERLWIRVTYEVEPWPWSWRRQSRAEVFNWLGTADPQRWVRGDQWSPSVLRDMKEPPEEVDWQALREKM